MNMTRFSSRGSFAALGFCLFFAGAALAHVNSNWQTAGGGDLADPDNWSQGALTYWGDHQSSVKGSEFYYYPCINPVGALNTLVFTASVDCCFSRFGIQDSSASPATTYVFDIGKDRTITFEGTGDAAIWPGVNSGKRGTMIWKSGTYKPRDGAGGKNQAFRFTTTSGCTTNIVDGPDVRMEFKSLSLNQYPGWFLCVTNGGYLSGSLAGNGTKGALPSEFLIVGKDPASGKPSTYDALNGNAIVHDNAGDNQSFLMRVAGGGVITNFYGRYGNRGHNVRLVVDNGGTLYGSKSGGITLGNNTTQDSGVNVGWPTNNAVIVKKGGKMILPYARQPGSSAAASLTVGSYGWGHSLEVDGGEVDAGVISIGNVSSVSGNNASNTVRILNGARVNLSSGIQDDKAPYGTLDIAGTGTLVTVRTDGLGVDGRGMSFPTRNFTLRIRDGAVVTNLEYNIGTRIWGSDSRLEVMNGARLAVAKGMDFAGSIWSRNTNCVALVEGGTLEEIGQDSETFSLGRENTYDSMKNALIVGTDGLLKFYRLRCFGYDNRLVVSNGTIDIAAEFRTTYEDKEECGGRTTVVFAGSRPRFVVHGTHTDFQREATIRFEVPAEGYATVPFETPDAGFSIKDCTMSFDVERYRKAGGGTLTLMRGAGAISMTAAQLEVLKACVPSGCKLWLTDDKKELKLKAPAPGLTIIFK